jgi:hypothetical protein
MKASTTPYDREIHYSAVSGPTPYTTRVMTIILREEY